MKRFIIYIYIWIKGSKKIYSRIKKRGSDEDEFTEKRKIFPKLRAVNQS